MLTDKQSWHLLDVVAAEALTLVEKVREESPQSTFDDLVTRCATRPEHMARVIMALAVFTPDDEGTAVLQRRVERAAAPKVVAA